MLIQYVVINAYMNQTRKFRGLTIHKNHEASIHSNKIPIEKLKNKPTKLLWNVSNDTEVSSKIYYLPSGLMLSMSKFCNWIMVYPVCILYGGRVQVQDRLIHLSWADFRCIILPQKYLNFKVPTFTACKCSSCLWFWFGLDTELLPPEQRGIQLQWVSWESEYEEEQHLSFLND